MDLFGSLWVAVDLFGPLWVSIDLFGSHWVSVDLCGPLWVSMDLCRSGFIGAQVQNVPRAQYFTMLELKSERPGPEWSLMIQGWA